MSEVVKDGAVNAKEVVEVEGGKDTGDSVDVNVSGDDKGRDSAEEALVTQSELQRRINSINKRHAKELEDARKKFELEAKKARMTEAEREAFDLDQREADLVKREAELTKNLLTASVKTKLATNGLSDEFTDLLVKLGDEEAIDAKIGSIKQSIDLLVNEQVKSKVGLKEPRVEGAGRLSKPKKRADIFKK